MNEEIWRPLIFKDQATGYTISSHGSVLDGQGKLRKFGDSQGYYRFYFKIDGKKKELIIHRLVASVFLDNPNNFNFVQHIDGNRFNNHVDNLKWVSSTNYCTPKSKEVMEASLNDNNWKPLIKDQPTGYEISSHGSVRDDHGELCKLNDSRGHYTFFFKKELLQIHRLVASAFVDNPNNFNFVQHVDGNPFNNDADNLKWVSSTCCCIPKNKELMEASLNDANWRPVYINGELANYSVSVDGDIRNATTLNLLAPYSLNGYTNCTLMHKGKKYHKKVHRLVAEAFIPSDDVEKKQVNHINYKRADNRVENLEWVTHSENIKHSHQKAGRKSCRIPVIRRDLDGTEPVHYDSVKQARKEFGSGVTDCLTGRRKTAYGYIWTYENDSEKNEIEIDLNEFKPIENHPEFLISKDGRMYSCSKKKFLTHHLIASYMKVKLGKKSYSVHRLVAIHFIDKPENYNGKLIVNHKDCDKLNNSIDNLEWVSYSDNTKHMHNQGGHPGARPVVQKDLEGNIVGEYPSASHAARAIQCTRYCILNACKNPDKSITHGFKLEFKSL